MAYYDPMIGNQIRQQLEAFIADIISTAKQQIPGVLGSLAQKALSNPDPENVMQGPSGVAINVALDPQDPEHQPIHELINRAMGHSTLLDLTSRVVLSEDFTANFQAEVSKALYQLGTLPPESMAKITEALPAAPVIIFSKTEVAEAHAGLTAWKQSKALLTFFVAASSKSNGVDVAEEFKDVVQFVDDQVSELEGQVRVLRDIEPSDYEVIAPC